jgi:branched-chain amino acid transport system ATP-binding protein
MSNFLSFNKSGQQSTININHITMRFGGLTAVDDFSLEMKKGELVGLIGPNGAGKTTIFNMITGVYTPTVGEIYFQDVNITGMPANQITKLGVARTFQNIRLFKSMTVFENVLVAETTKLLDYKTKSYMVTTDSLEGKELFLKVKSQNWFWPAVLNTSKYKKELRKMQEDTMMLLRRVGLDEYAKWPSTSLPYGQQRKLEIARALATGPKLLLLDEPAAGMNPQESLELMDFIRKILDEFDLTILLIEHDMKVVMGICQRLVVLDYGRIIATGTPDEIKHNPEVIKAYLGDDAV